MPGGHDRHAGHRAQDVAHSWWIPELGGKMDAVPGYSNNTWFKVPSAGVYRGQCAELCGRNHANMTAPRCAPCPPRSTQQWYDEQAEPTIEAAEQRRAPGGRAASAAARRRARRRRRRET